MASIANITINGNVGGEVRTREVNTQRGMQTVLNFSVATTRGFGERETTTWWSVDYFCKSEKARDYFTHAIGKGANVVVMGDAYMRTYETRDGETKTVLQVDARDITVPKPAPRNQDVTQPPRAATPAQGGLYDDDIPF